MRQEMKQVVDFCVSLCLSGWLDMPFVDGTQRRSKSDSTRVSQGDSHSHTVKVTVICCDLHKWQCNNNDDRSVM